ncbi:MAG: oligosaccharide repeat unit polymerase [Rubrivivax sp.]|nr:oligosaccharide repeat unit polymerase [Rubrivivax sp.]
MTTLANPPAASPGPPTPRRAATPRLVVPGRPSGRVQAKYLALVCLLYGIPNLLGLGFATFLDLVFVDLVPLQVVATRAELMTVALAVLASLVFVAVVAYLGTRCFGRGALWLPRRSLGRLALLLQLVSLASLLLYGYGRAGSEAESRNLLVILTSYLKADLIFLLYYAHVRPRLFPVYNFGLYVVLSTLSGWSGFWLTILLIEGYFSITKARASLKPKTLIFVGLFAIAAYPIAAQIRDTMRGDTVDAGVGVISYFRLLNRLDHLSNVVMIAQDARELSTAYDRGRVAPWYTNGVTQLVGRFTGRNADPFQRYLTTEYLVGGVEENAGWYSQVGIAGWLFILPLGEIPIYLLYVAMLIYLPYWMAGRFLRAASIIPMLHVATFGFVLHGWLEVHAAFIATLACYIALVRLGFGWRTGRGRRIQRKIAS